MRLAAPASASEPRPFRILAARVRFRATPRGPAGVSAAHRSKEASHEARRDPAARARRAVGRAGRYGARCTAGEGEGRRTVTRPGRGLLERGEDAQRDPARRRVERGRRRSRGGGATAVHPLRAGDVQPGARQGLLLGRPDQLRLLRHRADERQRERRLDGRALRQPGAGRVLHQLGVRPGLQGRCRAVRHLDRAHAAHDRRMGAGWRLQLRPRRGRDEHERRERR